jgi:hypothetical protein
MAGCQFGANSGHHGLFDQFVGARNEGRWHCDAKRLRRLEIDHHLQLGRQLDRQVGWFGALENAVDVPCRLTKQFSEINTIRDQAA